MCLEQRVYVRNVRSLKLEFFIIIIWTPKPEELASLEPDYFSR
jgi:hypothetical protein